MIVAGDYGFYPSKEQQPVFEAAVKEIKDVCKEAVTGFVPSGILGVHSRTVATKTLPVRFFVSEHDFVAACEIAERYADTMVPFSVSKYENKTCEEGVSFAV